MNDQNDDQNESVATELADTTEDLTADTGESSVADPTAESATSADLAAELSAEATDPAAEAPAFEDTATALTGAEPIVPAEDSGDHGTKEAEAAGSQAKSPAEEPWRKHLKRFHNDVNGVFATKENCKLVCVDKKAKDSFARNGRLESNKYFQLVVNLRRRGLGSKVGGKSVS